MAETFEIENVRMLVSVQLTRILMLFGRLNADYNARYLPITVNSSLILINELEQVEKRYYGFSEIFFENIERREKHSQVFNIPSSLQTDPTISGLRAAMYKLASPLIKNYCEEDKNFLHSLEIGLPKKIRYILLSRTKNNCEFLSVFCLPKDAGLVSALKAWCENELLGPANRYTEEL